MKGFPAAVKTSFYDATRGSSIAGTAETDLSKLQLLGEVSAARRFCLTLAKDFIEFFD